jgi:hypothetical protein
VGAVVGADRAITVAPQLDLCSRIFMASIAIERRSVTSIPASPRFFTTKA